MFEIAIMSLMNISLLVSSFIISKKVFGNKINVVSIYSVVWLLLSFFALFGFFGLYRPDVGTYLVIQISTITFNTTSIIVYRHMQKNKNFNTIPDLADISKRAQMVIVVLNILAILWLLQFVVKMLPLLLAGKWVLARSYYLNASTYHAIYTTKSALIFQWIIFPLINAGVIVSAYQVAKGKTKFPLLFVSSIGVVTIVVATAGRNTIFRAAMFYIFAYIMVSNKNFNLRKRIKDSSKLVKGVLVIAVVALVYITTQRRVGGDSTILENVMVYFLGPFIYLDYMLKNPDLFGLDSGMLFGRATFGFLTTPLEIIFSMLTGRDYAGADNIVTQYVNSYIPLSDTVEGNAISTGLYPFIKDFGIIGIVVGSIIFAIIVTFAYGKTKTTKSNTAYWNCVSIFMLYTVSFSEWQYELLFPASFTILAILYVTISKKHVRISKW